MRNFRMKDLEDILYFLGMRIKRDRNAGKVWIDQSEYITNIVHRFNMSQSKPVFTPLDPNQKLAAEMLPEFEEERLKMYVVPYREIVGRLLYAAQISRPDIAFAILVLSKFSNNSGQPHWTAAKRVLRYLKGRSSMSSLYERDRESKFTSYSNAD